MKTNVGVVWHKHEAETAGSDVIYPSVPLATRQRFKMAAISNSMGQNLLKEQEQRAALSMVPDIEIIWVTKRYNPTDLRVQVPVARFKLNPQTHSHSTSIEGPWLPAAELSPRAFLRTQDKLYASFRSTRCEEFSTLRQMLPSIGIAPKVRPPNWGSGYVLLHLPYECDRPASRFPIVDSPMTRYMNVMHQISPTLRIF